VSKAIIPVACAVIALAAASATAPQPASAADSFLIWVTPKSQRLGDFRVRRNPTYQGAINAFGEADQCTLVAGGAVGVAVWRSLGFRINVTTFGYPGPNATPCNAPEAHWIDRITVTGSRWRTRSGLQVGDPISKLHRLYPKARRHQGWRAGYWLVAARDFCIGDCPTRFVSVPRLIAKIKNNRVSAFVFHVGAQGD
jgi:hypothetical protein